MENIDIICLKETGYPLKNTFKILDEHHFKIKPYALLDVKNIPQYLSNINDPALQTGCEATACAIALSYMLKKNITKNEIASLMPKANPNEASFWDSFIGDIYHDGWGCMSTVAYNAIIKYLESHDLIDKYEVVNYTNTPLYKLLYLVSQGIPVIAYATMGNENTMYSRKYGSTIFNVNNNVLKWPGRDHCLVIIGYNLNTKQIYVADPEENSTAYRIRDLYLFENRFMQLYLQSIVILPIVQNDKNNN
jgi:uncharacterized protein YvpB